MLLTYEQMKHLNKGVNDDSFVFLDDGTVTDAERQALIDRDNFMLEQEGYHFIDNYQDLYKAAPIAVRQAVLA
ncbi:hypothetical protein R80B4_02022 [Fibrobacteres bacterium R8-0-B4]